VLSCLDLVSGQLIWRREVFDNPTLQNLQFGMSGSPLVIEDRVIVTPGAGEGSAAMAFAFENGEELWRSGNDPASYSSPMEATLCGHRQILSFNGAGLRAYDLDGRELWLQPWVTQGSSRVNVAQPIVLPASEDQPANEERIVISSGYDKGTALLRVTLIDDSWNVEVVWESSQLKSKLSSFTTFKNYAYGFDNGIFACLDLTDGQRCWKRGRYGHGQVLLVGDKLLIQAESGRDRSPRSRGRAVLLHPPFQGGSSAARGGFFPLRSQDSRLSQRESDKPLISLVTKPHKVCP
jgi:outer membrane protein assembly factor BamB